MSSWTFLYLSLYAGNREKGQPEYFVPCPVPVTSVLQLGDILVRSFDFIIPSLFLSEEICSHQPYFIVVTRIFFL